MATGQDWMNDVFFLIPARGGSKGIPAKNRSVINGQSLLMRVRTMLGYLPCLVDWKHQVVVSSDDNVILKEARALQFSIDRRPERLAQDESTALDLIQYIHSRFSLDTSDYKYFCYLEPTTPFRKASQIVEAYRFFKHNKAEAFLYVSDLSASVGQIDEENLFRRSDKAARRQERAKLYRETGVCYFFDMAKIPAITSLSDLKWSCLATDSISSLDLNDPEDLKIAEALSVSFDL